MTKVSAQIAEVNRAVQDREGKYLTFALGPEEYGLEILKVREIMGYMEITAVPQTPEYVRGVINLRGKVIPVIDLRAKFGMETVERTDQTCIIVVEITQKGQGFNTGIVVDRVQEVLDIAGENIEDTPQFGSDVETDFILGMGKIGESVKILLDIDKVLASADLSSFAKSAETCKKDSVSETCEKDSVSETCEKDSVSETCEENSVSETCEKDSVSETCEKDSVSETCEKDSVSKTCEKDSVSKKAQA